MATSKSSASPLFGWLEAGSDLMAAQLSDVTETVNKRLDETHALFEELQARGAVMDKQIKAQLAPSQVFTSFQELIMANPIFSMFGQGSKAEKREQQLQALSTKVDLLIEQVALLAAKEAAEKKAAEKPAAKKPATAAAKQTTKKSTTDSGSGRGSASTAKKSSASSTSGTKKAATKKTSASSSAETSTKAKSASSTKSESKNS
ncbi:hypothetical protein OCL06_15335 [Alteromonas sp. ASW11-19]|uniref:Phasin domain-containing protein n=1 Tax=Alteromonas salexigens TaxID=2982530 RepID=A0ABT2VSP3_9ALTE|nr:hypothetical protein [Alteromonas salexigens]MCU7555962.1 hypothetical protein [Alteromonas salexigens]